MGVIYRVSTHVGQNLELCLSAHGHVPETLWYIHIYIYYILYNSCIDVPFMWGSLRLTPIMHVHIDVYKKGPIGSAPYIGSNPGADIRKYPTNLM